MAELGKGIGEMGILDDLGYIAESEGTPTDEVLVVVDAQTDFVDGVLGTPEAEARIGAVADAVREAIGLVVMTLDTHGDDYMDTQEGKNLPVPHCLRGTDGWLPHPVLAEAIAERLDATGRGVPAFEKPTFGCPRLATQLLKIHMDHPIRRIRFVGFCTDICVVSNALITKAYLPDVEVVCEAWACAGVTPEAHEAAIKVMESCQVTVNRERPE